MDSYQRLVAYLYEYENGRKGRNVGFGRIEMQNDVLKLTLHMKSLQGRLQGGKVFLFYRDNERLSGIEVGEMVVQGNYGDFRLLTKRDNLMGSGISFTRICGLSVGEGEHYVASEWDGKELDVAHFRHHQMILEAAECHAVAAEPQSQGESGQTGAVSQSEIAAQPESVGQPGIVSQMRAVNQSEDNRHEAAGRYEQSADASAAEAAAGMIGDADASKAEMRVGTLESDGASKEELRAGTLEGDGASKTELPAGTVRGVYVSKAETAAGAQGAVRASKTQTTVGMRRGAGASKAEIGVGTMEVTGAAGAQTAAKSDEPADALFSHCQTHTFFENEEMEYCVKMEPKDIGYLPMEAWGMAGNSFLLHGYYQFHHLIFLKKKGQEGKKAYYMGVPGFYRNQDKSMAQLFGFLQFASCQGDAPVDGEFGYWLQQVVL